MKLHCIVLIAISLCSTEFFYAQQTLNNKPREVIEHEAEEYPFWNRVVLRHGGEMVDARKYVLEVVANVYDHDNKIVVYVTKRRKELDLRHASGEAVLTYKDGKKEIRAMHHKNNALAFDSLQAIVPVNIIFKITIKKKIIKGAYYYPGLK